MLASNAGVRSFSVSQALSALDLSHSPEPESQVPGAEIPEPSPRLGLSIQKIRDFYIGVGCLRCFWAQLDPENPIHLNEGVYALNFKKKYATRQTTVDEINPALPSGP